MWGMGSEIEKWEKRLEKKTFFVNENIIKMFLISLMHNGYPGVKKVKKILSKLYCTVYFRATERV